MHHVPTCAAGSVRAALVCASLLAACGGGDHDDWSFKQVTGLVTGEGFGALTYERPEGALWLRTAAGDEESDEATFYELPQGSRVVTQVDLGEIPANARAWNGIQLDAHLDTPTLIVGDRLWVYEEDQGRFVDTAPGERFHHFARNEAGELFGTTDLGPTYVLDEATDTWLEIDGAQSTQLASWDGRVISLGTNGVGELTASGVVDEVTCSDASLCQNFTGAYPSSDGTLWVQNMWNWWSYDGTSLTHLGAMPGEGTYISQVKGAAVFGTAVLSINREDFSQSEGRLLSWSPGESKHFDHGFNMFGGPSGSHRTSMVLSDERGGIFVMYP